MLANLSLYRRLLGATIRSQMQYRSSFSLLLTSAGLITFLEFGSLALVFERFGSIQGWTLGEVAFLYGLVEFGFGMMNLIFSGFEPDEFGQRVRLGTFDQFLLRPINLSVQVLGSEFALRRLGRIVTGAAIFTFALGQTEIHWTPFKVFYLPGVVLGIILFFGGLFVAGAAITFWTIESIETLNVVTYGGSYTIAHPMHIYPNWIRRFFTFILPAIFLNYYPALYFLDKPDPLNFPAFAPFVSPIAGMLVFLSANFFWRLGIRSYQSTGT